MKYTFETYYNNEIIKEKILSTLTIILEKQSCEQLKMPIFTCINEMLVNAIKANLKNLYFEEYEPHNNALEIIPYHKALQLFKLEMSSNRIDYLIKMAEKKDVKARITLEFDEQDVLYVTIVNPADLTEVEIENINHKIEVAKSYDTLSDYFVLSENDPNKEGGGLGIIFILMMLKSFGVDTDHFTISSSNHVTTSFLKIPVNKIILNRYLNNTGV